MKIYLWALILLFLYSCKEKEEAILPMPEFELVDLYGYKAEIFAINQPVRVKSVSETDSYFWEFGDGETSGEIRPSHVYQEPGTYTVRLTIRRGNAEQTVSKEIKVGIYYVDEVELINYANSFWVDDRKDNNYAVKEVTDLYLIIKALSPSTNPVIFKSQVFQGVKKVDLPLSIKIPDIELKNLDLNYSFNFYAKSDNEQEGIVASNHYYYTMSSSSYIPEKNEGSLVISRGSTPGDGYRIRFIFKRKLLH